MAAAGGGIWTAFSPTGSGFATKTMSYTNGYFVSTSYTGSFVKKILNCFRKAIIYAFFRLIQLIFYDL